MALYNKAGGLTLYWDWGYYRRTTWSLFFHKVKPSNNKSVSDLRWR
jgi:hypothetical protein